MTENISIREELGRKVVHLSSIVIVLLLFWAGKEFTLNFLMGILLVFLVIEYLRVEKGGRLPVFWRFYRPGETETLGGNVTFMIGAMVAISVFSPDIASAAIIMTTFGDMAAALVGRTMGRTWILPERALEGCLAEFVVDLIIGFIFLDSILVILVMALTATVVETLIYKMDDNLVLPIAAGGMGHLATWVLRGLI